MKKFLLSIFIIFLSFMPSYAISFNRVDKVLNEADLDRQTTVSISVKNIENNKIIYDKKDEKLLHPASSLKIFTFAPILNTLGVSYEFKTQILKDNKNNIYIKLGADPLLTYSDLRQLVRGANLGKINKIYIDDSIIDKIPYPEGWLTDDYMVMPEISPYTLNQNKAPVTFTINPLNQIECYQPNAYKFSFINELEKGETTNISIYKNYGEELEIINVQGTVKDEQTLLIPVNNPKFYFIANFKEILEKEKIKYYETFNFAQTPNNAKVLSSVSHNIEQVGKSILQNSDNFSSEVAFKVAGGKYKNKKQGSTKDGIEMFYDYYKNLSIDTDDVKISDASGVSRYNLLTANWVANTLSSLYKNIDLKNYMATPDVGTLSQRLRHLNGKLWAKTGTLSGISSIEGYMISKDNKELAFVIIIQNFNKKPSIIKAIEDDLIDAIYKL